MCLGRFKEENTVTEQKGIKLTSVKATSLEQLDELLGLIHDEHFDLDEVQYRPDLRVVEIPYRRIFHNGPSRLIRNWLFYQVKEVDVVRAKMRIHYVNEYEVHDPAQIGTYSFNTVEFEEAASTLVVQCNEELELRMKVSGLLIDSEDLEVRGKSRISYLLGVIQSYYGRVYD